MSRPAASRPFPNALGAAVGHAAARVPQAPRRILLASGDRELRRLMGLALRGDGHVIVEAADGSELLEAIASLVIDGDRPFDVIWGFQTDCLTCCPWPIFSLARTW